jgi:hypothetical protein
MSNCEPVGTAARSRNKSSCPVPRSSVVIACGASPVPSVSHAVLVQLPSKVGVHRALEQVTVVRRQVTYPCVEVHDLVGVFRLTELDVTEALTAAGVPEDDFEIEGRRLRTPRRFGVGTEREDGCQRGDAHDERAGPARAASC